MHIQIILAASDEEINACYPVMAELRPHVTQNEFVDRVRHQAAIAGYELACVIDQEVKAVAGFRISGFKTKGLTPNPLVAPWHSSSRSCWERRRPRLPF